jgi:hypothetical protein
LVPKGFWYGFENVEFPSAFHPFAAIDHDEYWVFTFLKFSLK